MHSNQEVGTLLAMLTWAAGCNLVLVCRSVGAARWAQDVLSHIWVPPEHSEVAGAEVGPVLGSPGTGRLQTRDTLGKGKEDVPQPLYLFVSLIAIFAYMWWCIKYFTIFGLTGFVLWGRCPRASQHGRTHPLVVARDQPCLCLYSISSPEGGAGAASHLAPTLLSDGLLLKAETLSGTSRLCLAIPSL